MRSGTVGQFVVVVAILSAVLALPVRSFAQEAALSGTVTDTTGAVLPGVTLTATHTATGNVFVAVTDGGGAYRIPVRIGGYQLTAELQGFSTVSRTGVELLIGQVVVINLQMAPSSVQETVTVTGEAPLIDVATSAVGGNIDSRQMQDLPVQGRDWTTLALLAPGSRTTEGGGAFQERDQVHEYQINVDGQQVTQGLGIAGQPLYSRDSIAEFQFVSNRFDATQGRSAGVQVNAVTKSGTNTLSGLFSGYFRNSDWNAKDHVLKQVIPLSNQQISTAVGGPIRRDRLHFFANYEYDRTPKTAIWNTPYPAFNISLPDILVKKIGGLRLDYQISPSTRLMGKAHYANDRDPLTGATATTETGTAGGGGTSSTRHPASTNTQTRTSQEYLAQLTQVLSNRAVNEIKAGFAGWQVLTGNRTHWSNHWQKDKGITGGHPRVQMVGFSILGNESAPRVRDQNMYSVRDDFTLSYDARGRHDLKTGAEYLFMDELTRNCRVCMGQIDARVSAIPPALMQAIFPDPFNVDTWNLAALSPYTRRYTLGVADDFTTPFNVPRTAAWIQDDWHLSARLTVNLGLRYDLTTNAWVNDVAVPPILEAGRPDDTNNIQPRLGFAYTLNDRTVLRGGIGLYYNDVTTNMHMWTSGNQKIASIEINNDGRPDFAANPFNGPAPTAAQAFANLCDVNTRPGCLRRTLREVAPPPDYAKMQNAWQTSIGFQRQFGDVTALTVDYVHNRTRNEKVFLENVNVTYDAATGVNLPYSVVSLRPYPLIGIIEATPFMGRSDYHAVQTALTKRFSDRWQGSVTYTVGGLWQADPNPMSGARIVNFPVAPDLGNEYTLGETDQRHRAVFNGIWHIGYGLQVSGIYFYGAGERRATNNGLDLRDLGAGPQRLRADGTIIPRNSFVGDPVKRVDLRLQQRVPLGGSRSIDGIVEVYNVFDRANYGSYTLNESSPAYRQPAQNPSLAYAARTLQLGFRFTF